MLRTFGLRKRKRMHRSTKISSAVFFCAFLVFTVWTLSFKSLTGSWFPKTIEEPLNNPEPVSKITPVGIELFDGRVIPIPHVKQVPVDFRPLSDSVKDGIEIDDSGEVYGRLRIHRWCGNDPVRKHIARINLADLIWTYRNLEDSQRESFYSEYGLDPSLIGYLNHWRIERLIQNRSSRGR